MSKCKVNNFTSSLISKLLTLMKTLRSTWPTIRLIHKCANSSSHRGQRRWPGWAAYILKDLLSHWLIDDPQINMTIGDISEKEILSLYSPSGRSFNWDVLTTKTTSPLLLKVCSSSKSSGQRDMRRRIRAVLIPLLMSRKKCYQCTCRTLPPHLYDFSTQILHSDMETAWILPL